MKNFNSLIVILIFCFLYGGINYYIGLRGWQAFGITKKCYWPIYILLAVSVFIGRWGNKTLPPFLTKIFIWIGAYWLAFIYYTFLILIIIEVFRLLDKYTGIFTFKLKADFNYSFLLGIGLMIIVSFLLIYGTLNAQKIRITEYNVTISKKAPAMKKLQAVMVSDIHLGNIVDNKRLKIIVQKINRLNPDIIFLVGDTIDENVAPFIEQKMELILAELKAKYGCYAVLGNHEYIGGHTEEIITNLEKAGIQVLRDNYIKIEDSIYIIGRDDFASKYFSNKNRKPLSSILKNVDKKFPLILLDHQPRNLDESEKEGIDLQFSGHTHKGQFFPNNLITSRIFEVDWGYLKKENLQVIVSSGVATWGPPIRIGNKPEIVKAIINFVGK